VILHVVLYRPKSSTPTADVHALIDALAAVRAAVPSIGQFWTGRRMAGGPEYVLGDFPDFPFAAVVSFHDRLGLLEYLQHPAHAAVSELFNRTADAALIYDFEVEDPADRGGEAPRLLLDPRAR
jgi:hypothetical protein